MNELIEPLGSHDHILGRPDALVTMVEYGDYECPFCSHAYREVNLALRMLGGDVLFAFRNFPLTELHPYAFLAAQAAEAAGAQGQFWPMHALLFENQDALEPSALLAYARSLGLDTERFADDLRTGVYLPKVEHDLRTGVDSGVTGTPTFFVDGHRYAGAADAAALTSAVQRALRQQVVASHAARA